MIKVITPPTGTPVSLAEVKLNLRIVQDDEDADVQRMINAATDMVQGRLNRFLLAQTVEIALDFFPWPFVRDPANTWGIVTLLGAPLVNVVSVKYYDGTGTLQTLDPANYIVNDYVEPAELTPAYNTTWPVAQLRRAAVQIRYNVGYADAAHVPESIRQWILLAVGTMYANRESAAGVQMYSLPDDFFQQLLQPYMVYE